MQTILGSGGAIGTPLAKELARYTNKIRLVSRNPKKVNESDELFPADLTDAAQVDKAISGSEIVYLVVGFTYNIKVWQREWPKLMQQVIRSCIKYGARLVFFDNVYMYDRDYMNNMTEDTPLRPTSLKGMVRAEIAQMILDEVAAGRLEALIARSADFYSRSNSVLVEMVVKNLMKNRAAMWFSNVHKIHTFTDVVDAAKGTAMLGNTPEAYNQIWHLPTDRSMLTGKQWIDLVAGILHTKSRYFTLSVWMVSVFGLFVPVFREFREMIYQYDRDYIFNSSKFEKKFNYIPVKPETGLKQLIQEL